MNQNRSSQYPESKQSSIPSVSSHILPMTTSKNHKNPFLTQALAKLSTAPDLRGYLPSIPLTSNRDAKRSRTMSQPNGTLVYTVGDTDTLEKVALRFNSTPSELLQLNKLNTRTIFPGQTLFVPEESSSNNSDEQQTTTTVPTPARSPTLLTKKKDGDAFILLTDRRLSSESNPSPQPQQPDVGPIVWSMIRQSTARPGRAQRLKSDLNVENESSLEDHLDLQQDVHTKQAEVSSKFLAVDGNHHLDEECLQRFIKVNVRLMTEDHQSVNGTLLVTPNAVMFDPDVLDPLVKEHGILKYGLIIRMEFLARIGLYEDLAMFEHEATSRDEEKRKMCHSTSVKHAQYCPTTTDEIEIHHLMSSLLDRIDKELNPSISTDVCCMLFDAATSSSTIQRHISRNSSDKNDDNEITLSTTIDDVFFDESFQSLDDYKHSIGILLDNDEHVNKNFNRVPSQISYGFDWTRFRRAIKIKKGCHLENCVPLDQFNKRFGEIDKLLYKQQQNYCTPPSIDIPYYLCIKTSINKNDVPSLYAKQYKKSIGKSSDNISGKKRQEQEYWFSVPKEKTDRLCSFFLRWTPEHGSDSLLDNNEPSSPIDSAKSHEQSTNKGFILLADHSPELSPDNSLSENQPKTDTSRKTHYLKRQNTLLKEWEIINVDEIYRHIHSTQANDLPAFDSGFLPPKLLQPSTLINEEQSKQILLELPARLQNLDWYMIFSTETHGFSLNQLYRRAVELDHDLPSLIVIKDLEQNVFGAFVPHQFVISEGFYGTGESFLFTLVPEFRVYNWSGDNEFFVKGDIHSLGFGIGEGTPGLWLDADLYHGRTCPSKTFNNERLSSNEDFIIASIEVWTFTN